MIRDGEPSIVRLSRFTVIGTGATLIYAAFCSLLLWGLAGTAPLPAMLASAIAYLVSGIFSYLGHKYFSFASAGAHRVEAPRFIAVSALGLSLAIFLPALSLGLLDLPNAASIALTCVVIPAANFVCFDRWVFRHV